MSKVLVFDTETTGKWNYQAHGTDVSQPHLVQLGALLFNDADGEIKASIDALIKPIGWDISEEVSKIHGVTHADALSHGIRLSNAGYVFRDMLETCDIAVAHNMDFDKRIMTKALWDVQIENFPWESIVSRCTMLASTPILKLPKEVGRGYKWPKLKEAHLFLCGTEIVKAHTAMGDTLSCLNVYLKLCEMGVFK